MSNQIPIKNLKTENTETELVEYDLYQKRKKIYTRRITGFFQVIRTRMLWVLMLGYFLTPWINFHDRQGVFFDLPSRQFHIFGITFWPQDFFLLAALLIISAFALFLLTTLFGRVWCGYTCPQTVWTMIFMWIEEKTEGSRNQRIKLDKEPMSKSKFYKKFSKHSLWVIFSWLTGLTFVGYFTPVRDLVIDFFTLDANLWSYFWIAFFTGATYLFAGWMREQVCTYMCPYARFQSVMFDSNTLVISYDATRGEGRGARKKGVEPKDVGLGDCIDCNQCVHVCPAGIDIRDGLQYECIGCALCVDACDDVMDKMGYARGLVSYTTESRLEGKKSKIIRPKSIGYAIAMLSMVVAFSFIVGDREPLELDVLKDRNRLYNETPSGMIENIYTVKILNMDQSKHTFELSVNGLEQLNMIGRKKFVVNSGEVRSIPLSIQVPPHVLTEQKNIISFTITSTDPSYEATKTTESRFIGPIGK
ncbi:cytochrome c oxidase accessory protein CcoG [Marinomonas sp. 2405UD68-3]|uniref:cytochrome c oxidase accessory protein CcoG n=1 Tax=Marinomonas sp. 2405UD68-3 TaxID=3391835 RepID=UPI0039C97EA5